MKFKVSGPEVFDRQFHETLDAAMEAVTSLTVLEETNWIEYGKNDCTTNCYDGSWKEDLPKSLSDWLSEPGRWYKESFDSGGFMKVEVLA